MSLLDTNPTLSTSELQAKALREIRNGCRSILDNMTCTYRSLYSLIWSNQDHLTPQQVIDALGNEAGELFRLAALCKQTVNAAVPDSLTDTPPFEITINDDGTVTLGDPTD